MENIPLRKRPGRIRNRQPSGVKKPAEAGSFTPPGTNPARIGTGTNPYQRKDQQPEGLSISPEYTKSGDAMEALQIPVTLYIHLDNSQFSTRKYFVSSCDMSRDFKDYILLEKRQITIPFTEPDAFVLIERQVTALRDKKAAIQQTTNAAVAAIDDQIQQLLCIDHTPVDEDEIPY